MALHRRRPALGDVAFYLAIVSAAAIPTIFLLTIVGDLLGGPHQPMAFLLVFGLVVAAVPVLLVSAIVTAHISRRRDPQNRRSRYALIIGYCVLAAVASFTALSIFTFMSIRQ